MNKILIVGHPQSGYQDVERLLHACGMAAAKPSRRDGFMPDEIGATLARAHSIPRVESLPPEAAISQCNPGPVWHGLALDLMLGNIDQPLWGWADPEAIHWLEYWRDLDPALHFILVYDSPHSVLVHSEAARRRGGKTDTVEALIRTWNAYHAALVRFHQRNATRCMLVHAQQARASAAAYLSQVRARIDAPWRDQLEAVGDPCNPAMGGELAHHEETQGDQALPPAESDIHARSAVDVATFIAHALLVEAHPECLQLYEELQATANLPWLDGTADQGPVDARAAWRAVADQECALQEQGFSALAWESRHARAEEALRQLEREVASAKSALSRQEREAGQLRADLERERLVLEQKTGEIGRLKADLEVAKARTEAEKNTAARHQASLREREKELEQLRTSSAAARSALDQELAAVRNQLRAATDADKPLIEENENLLRELHRVQEQLEVHLAGRAPVVGTSPVATSAPAALLYGAGERVKQELAYRIGAVIVRRCRSLSGWMGLPAALRAEMRRIPSEPAEGLAPLSAYADAADAERLRAHLSWRIGSVYLANSRSPLGWVRMPLALRRELVSFRAQKAGVQ